MSESLARHFENYRFRSSLCICTPFHPINLSAWSPGPAVHDILAVIRYLSITHPPTHRSQMSSFISLPWTFSVQQLAWYVSLILYTVHYWTANEKFSVIALIYSRTYSILEFYLSIQVDLQLFYSVLVLSFGKLWNMAVLFSTAIETIYVIEEMICSRTPDVRLIFVLRRYNVTFTHFWRWNIELRESTMCMFVSVNVAGEGCWNKAN